MRVTPAPDIRKHYIQCFGRNPQNQDIIAFIERAQALDKYHEYDKLLLLSKPWTKK